MANVIVEDGNGAQQQFGASGTGAAGTPFRPNHSIQDGDDACQGTTTDAAVVGDTSGTVSGKLRGLTKIFNSVWDSTNNFLASAAKLFNGTSYVSANSLSAANLSAMSGAGGLMIGQPGNWSVISAPASGSQATASKAAGGTGVRHIANSITASLNGGTGLLAAQGIAVYLRDGASGAGTIVWVGFLSIPNTVGANSLITISGLNIVGSANTAMTLEFSAGATGVIETVTLTGYDVN